MLIFDERPHVSLHRIPTAIVIDDDRETVSVFCEYLGLIDVSVLGTGYNGKEAVEMFEKVRPDVVFLDLLMPDYDGFYALERIKQMDSEANVAVITADRLDERDMERLERLCPSKIVMKPFEVEQIISMMDNFRR